jgi:hypothetical protein
MMPDIDADSDHFHDVAQRDRGPHQRH